MMDSYNNMLKAILSMLPQAFFCCYCFLFFSSIFGPNTNKLSCGISEECFEDFLSWVYVLFNEKLGF